MMMRVFNFCTLPFITLLCFASTNLQNSLFIAPGDYSTKSFVPIDSSYHVLSQHPLENKKAILLNIQVFDKEGFALPYADFFLMDKRKKCLAVVNSDKGGNMLISGLGTKINHIDVGFLGYNKVPLATKEFMGKQTNLKVVLSPQLLTTE